ncbi:MAG TPA: alpha-N-arabinofuranosidase [Verrucomicrobia bacterium]|nr:alpha-N-arabinofuranosidase [Verrucomicrobiota bacterium]
MKSIIRKRSLLLAAAFVSIALPASSQENNPESAAIAQVTIDASQTGEPISPYIYGQFIEHLGRCIYGGIWAEMLEDRKFYYPIPATNNIWRTTREGARVLAASPWKVLGAGTTVSMVEKDAFSGKHSPHVRGAGGVEAGIYQEELGLMKDREYTGYVVLAGEDVGPVTVTLSWGDGPNDRQTHRIRRVRSRSTKVPFRFVAGADTDNGRLTISTRGNGTLRIGCVSLMPADNIEGFRRDTLELLKQLNSPVYRWPGGNFVSGYDWRDGIGDRDRRPTRTNPAWTGIEPNDVGMHEFIRFCELIGTEPMIAVNTGFGDAYSAAAQVEYANGSTDTPMGRLRAQNGSRKPFKVKWWCVGNEMWGNWQLGYMRLNHYVLKHNWVEEKMREVDPSIVTVASGDLGNNWSRGMLTSCADHMDLISEHFYCQTRANFTVAEHVAQIPNNVKRIADAHRKFREELPSLKGKDIRIALDEWNYWYGPHVFGELGTRYFLKDALGIAAGLHEYFRNSDIIFMANYAQTVNVIGCIKTTKTHAEFDSTAFPLMLYRREFGTIPLKVEHTAAPLDVAAALTSDRKAVTVAVVNPTENAVRMKLNLNALRIGGPARSWTITGPDPMAFNHPGEPRKVDVEEGAPADLNGIVSVRPLSVTLWRATLR